MECDGTRERSAQKLQEGEADPADPGDPQGWIKHCRVMGWQWRRDTFPTISGPLGLLLSLSCQELASCLFSITVCQTEWRHGGCWARLVIRDPQSPCLSKWQDRCMGPETRWMKASVCVGVLCSPPSGCFRPACQAGVGVLLIPRTKGWVLGHCAVLCHMDCNPLGSSVHEGREGSAQLGPGARAGQVTWWLYPPADLGVGGGTKAATFHVYLRAKNFKNIFHFIF